MKGIPTYLHCHNCGRFLPDNATVERWYCSLKCAESYGHCRNCGRYFKIDGDGLAGKQSLTGMDEGKFCGPECAEGILNTPRLTK